MPRPLGGAELGKRQRGKRKVGAGERRGRQHGERIHHQMPARRADLVFHVGAENARMHGRASRLQRALDQPRIGLLMLAEGHDLRDFRRRRFLREALEMLAVAIEHGRAARLDAFEDFRLGVGDAVERLEIFQMHGRNRR